MIMSICFRSCRGKLAFLIRMILVAWILLWVVFSFFVYPSLLPEQGDYFAQVPDTKQLEVLDVTSCRLDDIFLPIIKQSRVLQLSSVPSQHRIPSGVTNVTEYFASSPKNVAPYREYFFDYNPSIIRIPKDQVPTMHAAKAVYMVSFRVSNLQYCFHPEDRKRMVSNEKVQPKDWLGLALLDAEWNMVSETVVNVQSVIRGAQDFRLFAIGGNDNETTDHTTVYLNSNDILLPLKLALPSSEETTNTWVQLTAVFDQQLKQSSSPLLPVWVAPKQTRCAPCGKPRSCGKNFHFFTSAASPHQLWAEVWPSSPHVVRLLGDESPCRRDQEPQKTHLTENSPAASFVNPEIAAINEAVEITKNLPRRRAKAPFWLTRGRGSACCLPIRHPKTGKSLLMGIAHSKTLGEVGEMQPNHYVSTLYAFEDQPPFALVAQSGYFCLPFPGANMSSLTAATDNPMVNITRWRVLRLGKGREHTNCPRIHFVSGMVLDANDPHKVIVTYGVNDCFSRFVQVLLSDLIRILFYGPL